VLPEERSDLLPHVCRGSGLAPHEEEPGGVELFAEAFHLGAKGLRVAGENGRESG
jgi:hypothetical protein